MSVASLEKNNDYQTNFNEIKLYENTKKHNTMLRPKYLSRHRRKQNIKKLQYIASDGVGKI